MVWFVPCDRACLLSAIANFREGSRVARVSIDSTRPRADNSDRWDSANSGRVLCQAIHPKAAAAACFRADSFARHKCVSYV